MNRYKELRKKRGLTQLEASKLLNVDQSTISKWEQDKAIPDIYTLNKISELYNVSIDFLLGKETPLKNNRKGVKIPVLGSIPAGIALEAIEDILDYEEISEEQARTGEFFALKVKGESMEPTIRNGDIIIFRKQEDADSGKICVVMINGNDATLKEIKKEPNGLWVLPHNPNSAFKPTFYSIEDVEKIPVRILGVAVEIRRSL